MAKTIVSRRLSRRNALKVGGGAVAAAVAVPALAGRADAAAAGSVRWVRGTRGRGGLGLDQHGAVVALSTAAGAATLGSAASGLFVADPVNGTRYPVLGTVTNSGRGGLRLQATVPQLSVTVDVTFRPAADNAVLVEGGVTDATGQDRVLDTYFALSTALTAGTWQPGVIDPVAINASSAPTKAYAMPLGVVTDDQRTFALGYAIPPEAPCRFEVGVEAGPTFVLRQRWGLSPDATGPLHSRAPFAFVVDLGVDPVWGFRSALDRYYLRSPQWFTNPAGRGAPGHRDRAYGVWQMIPRSYYTDPDGMAFHMGGRGCGSAKTLAGYDRNDEWGADDRAGVRTFPYAIPGQCEVTDLPTLPTTYAEAIAAYNSWTHPPKPFGVNNGPNSYRSAEELKALIATCGVQAPNGDYEVAIRNTQWGGNSVTFPTNASPYLHLGDDTLTVGKYLLDYYLPLMLSDSNVDGLFSDSLFGWGRYYNYRKDHFPSARIPLTYADTTSTYGTAYTAGIFNDFSQLEYLWELRKRLHAKGKLLMTNGLRDISGETRVFDGFASDVVGVELQMSFILTNEADVAFYRTLGRGKPVVSMIYQEKEGIRPWEVEADVAALWRRALLYGLAPGSAGMFFEDDVAPGGMPKNVDYGQPALELKYQHRYLPVLRKLMQAGWEPVTGVRSSAAKLRIERYGAGDRFYLVLVNEGDAGSVAFTADRHVVPGVDSRRVMDVLTGRPASTSVRQALAGRGTLTLDAQELLVLSFG